MVEVSNQVVAALLVLFIVVSITGTWYALSLVVSAPGAYMPTLTSGKVKLLVPEEPVPTSSQAGITVYVSSG